LGEVNLDLGDLGAALRAFEQVAARDGRDVDSLRQVGILNAQLGHPQEAKLAFDRALAISPNDAAALCMRSAVAQLSVAPRDAYAAAREAKAIDSRCRGLGEPGIRR